ncbi:hypothetical protein D7D52_32485 [Nocardia yunnanensis]|uniref:Uncharacterized protein n=1 Tax=Nocardia yunnanensis TaxID=2382165 RepID=A0A386ZJM5_9NOCA|nr:hypothetical protein [Nocardia yunnanensis]AYF77751.1 hypothetical protein D7D52_32485 [Nocardia yunnanensis]
MDSGHQYLQHSDGSWSIVGRDGWPVDPETYAAELAELEADVESLEGLAVQVIDVEPISVRDIPERKELPR